MVVAFTKNMNPAANINTVAVAIPKGHIRLIL